MECGNSGTEGIMLLNAVSRKKETVWELGKRYALPPIYVFTVVYISAQIDECLLILWFRIFWLLLYLV